MIDLRSDTVTKPTQAMRQAIYDAEVGDDCFGDDPTVLALEEYCASFFNKEAALFTTGGTLSNQLAMKTLTRPGDEVVLHASYHINYFESASTAAFSGVNFSLMYSDDGIYTVDELERVYRSKCRWNKNYALPRVVVVENTLGCKVGRVFPLETMKAVCNYASSIGAYRYLDGARILHAAVATGRAVTDFTDNADLMAMCLSKALGAPIGSILVGPRDLIAEARRYRKWFGGDMHQAGFAAAAGLFAMKNNVTRLVEDHENTRFLFELINDMGEAPATYGGTNMLTIDISQLGMTTPNFVALLARNGVGSLAYNPTEVRFMSHINIERSQLQAAAAIIKNTVREVTQATPSQAAYA